MKRYSFRLVKFILFPLAVLCSSCYMGGGSYADSVQYRISIETVDSLIGKFDSIKQAGYASSIFSTDQYGDTVNHDGLSYYNYMCHFKISNMGEDIAFKCAININQKPGEDTWLKLVSVAVGDGIGKNNWLTFNKKEMSKDEEEEYKLLFEKHIMNRLGVEWERIDIPRWAWFS